MKETNYKKQIKMDKTTFVVKIILELFVYNPIKSNNNRCQLTKLNIIIYETH